MEDKALRSEADLRRATSDLYYVLFHRVCEELVSPIGADPDNAAFVTLYTTLYRLPDHRFLETKCREVQKADFTDSIEDFAQQLIVLKNKRHKADYDPLSRWSISRVENDLKAVEKVVSAFDKAQPDARVRFALFVSIKGRKPE